LPRLDANLASDPVRITMIKGLVAGATNMAIALGLGAHWPSGGARQR
jgi:hypothetical protein